MCHFWLSRRSASMSIVSLCLFSVGSKSYYLCPTVCGSSRYSVFVIVSYAKNLKVASVFV